MFKKYLVLSLIVLVFNLAGGGSVFAQTKDDKDAELTQKIKTKIAKVGAGEKSKVLVELRNQTKIKGYVGAIDDDSFTVIDKKTGSSTKVDYGEVKSVSRNGLSTGVKIAIVAAVAVPAIILLRILQIRCNNEGGC